MKRLILIIYILSFNYVHAINLNESKFSKKKLYQNNNISLSIKTAFDNAEPPTPQIIKDLDLYKWSCLRVTPLFASSSEISREAYPNFYWYDGTEDFKFNSELNSLSKEFTSSKMEDSTCTVQAKETKDLDSINTIIDEVKLNSFADIRSEVTDRNLKRLLLRQYSCTNRDIKPALGDQEMKAKTFPAGTIVQLEACVLIN